VLEAIERNDCASLPARPYARGFVAAFAREVGLPADETVREYFHQFQAPPIEAPPSSASGPGVRWRRWVAGACVLLAVVALGVAILRRPDLPPDTAPTVGTSGTVPSAVEGRASPAPGPPAHAGPPAIASAPADAVVVTLETTGPSWIAATVDGRREIYAVLQPGTKTTLRAADEIVIRTGDAGAVRWSLNGRDAVAMGRPGEVRRVRITPADVRELSRER
jgi:hypothetical protein